MLPTYEKLFDVPYPLSKMDLVAIPDFEAGAMENWGLLLFRETALLATKTDSSIDSVRKVTLTIAHEMSHMVRSAPHHPWQQVPLPVQSHPRIRAIACVMVLAAGCL